MLFFTVAFALLASYQVAHAHFSTSSEDIFIRDDVGRVSFFHGENFVQKGPPWYPEVLLNVSNIKAMQSWGFNTIRLGVMWAGVEPEKGVFNETYLDVIGEILDNLEAHDIHAIIDVHQDVLSSYFCLYDGAPKWLVDMSTSSQKEFPWPLPWDDSNPCTVGRPWGANYLAEATGAAFQDLYDNVNGMQDHFAAFWTKVASTLKDKRILGYEIINEPWAGNIYAKPSLLLPGVAGKDNLQPLYDNVAKAIRTSDADHIVFYEPVTWGMIFNGTVSGSGLSHVPGGAEFASKSAFSFHYYCWWFDPEKGIFNKRTCDNKFGPKVFEQSVEESRLLGGTAMLTEWGQGCDPTNGVSDECAPIMDLADSHLVSWTDWYWTGPLMNGWNATPEAIAIFSRTFAKSVAGTPTKMKFDSKTLDFELCYQVDTNIVEPTVIFANFDVHYLTGVNVRISGNASKAMRVQVDHSQISVYYDGSSENSSDISCCVYVTPK